MLVNEVNRFDLGTLVVSEGCFAIEYTYLKNRPVTSAPVLSLDHFDVQPTQLIN